ncbi:MAG: hypothetical protein U9N61_02980 [Euryarchaeota archaeon]|nr:hypothetical protein [Euryarchaeota archaeon]
MGDEWNWGYILEELHDFVMECGDDIGEDVIVGLTAGARETVCDMIEEMWCNENE